MAQNITLMGASYSDVPAVVLPKTGGGTASFTDVTDTTAAAGDVASGKYFYTAAGVKTQGTASGGGGGGSLSDQVRFFDYDGTLVDSYSKADFNALSAMPSNPSHTGLTAQGWNWTLAQAKAQLTACPDGVLNIGQMYTTDTGETRLYIHIDEDTPDNRLTFYVRFTSSTSNNVTLNWGDGTVETKGSTSATNYSHTYATNGDYVIKLTVNTGTISFVGSASYAIYGATNTTNYHNGTRIRRVEIGNNVTSVGKYAFRYCYSIISITIPSTVTSIGESAFAYCTSLTSITIPSGVTSIGNNTFQYCYSLTSITIPSGVTSIGNNAFAYCTSFTSITIPSGVTSIGNNTFQYCYAFTSIIIPSNVTSIGNYAFNYCDSLASITILSGITSIGTYAFQYSYSLTRLTIPSSVTSIGGNAFNSCYGVGEYHFEPTTPPTITNTNVFTGIANDCKIYVPYSADHSVLTAYQTASYWSTYASRMVEESP